MLVSLLLALTFIPMLFEAAHAARHDAVLRGLGAVEPDDDVIRVMQVVYPASFAAMAAEAWIRNAQFGRLFVAGLAVFAAAKALKYWAIRTLGVRWTFRVLVPPGSSRTAAGPYRFLRHPNYVAVAGELIGMALMAGAPVTGIASTIAFVCLMAARVRVEERALTEFEATEIAEAAEKETPQGQRR